MHIPDHSDPSGPHPSPSDAVGVARSAALLQRFGHACSCPSRLEILLALGLGGARAISVTAHDLELDRSSVGKHVNGPDASGLIDVRSIDQRRVCKLRPAVAVVREGVFVLMRMRDPAGRTLDISLPSPEPTPSFESVNSVARRLALVSSSPRRLEVLWIVGLERPDKVTEIARTLAVSLQVASRHVIPLYKAGVLTLRETRGHRAYGLGPSSSLDLKPGVAIVRIACRGRASITMSVPTAIAGPVG